MGDQKVALITGANTGIGYALVKKLLKNNGAKLTVCLACRNRSKAESARNKLLSEFPEANIDLLDVDTSCLKSVFAASEQVVKRYHHLDYLYLNAGILAVSGLDWNYLWKCLFSRKCIHMFRTGDGVMKQVDGWTDDGLKQVFATNIFGHFVFIHEIERCLGGTDRPSQLIWTSSSNALKESFDIDDIQHLQGKEPYGSSKYMTDMISVVLNEKLNSKGIHSHTTCPGLVMSNLTYGIVPSWLWMLILPFFWLLRMCIPSMTLTAENGCQTLYWLSCKDPQFLDPMNKFHSNVSCSGNPYTGRKKMDIDVDLARTAYKQLDELRIQKKILLAKNNTR